MSREWKPGDVAVVADDTGASWEAVRDDSGWFSIDYRIGWMGADDVDVLRPLVLIDPEDREQVGNLANLIRPCGDDNHCTQYPCGSLSCWTDRLGDALREFADPTPPKPEEPTGLGAVVEDAEGRKWVRTADTDCKRPWSRYSSFDDSEYADIAAVKVLSEGVS